MKPLPPNTVATLRRAMAPILANASLYYAPGRRVSRGCALPGHPRLAQHHGMPETPTKSDAKLTEQEPPFTREEAVADLRRLIEEGLASGIDDSNDMESIWDEVNRRLKQARRE